MPWKTPPDPEWVPEEYPKMLVKKDKDGFLVPAVYPPGHEKQGRAVVFENEDEEKMWGGDKGKVSPATDIYHGAQENKQEDVREAQAARADKAKAQRDVSKNPKGGGD